MESESGVSIPFSSCVHICFVSTSELLYLLQLLAVRSGIARVPGQACVHVVCVLVKTSPER